MNLWVRWHMEEHGIIVNSFSSSTTAWCSYDLVIMFTGPAPGIPRLGVNPYQWGTECLSGDVKAGPATSFPQSIGMVMLQSLWRVHQANVLKIAWLLCIQAASFNYDMLYKVVRAISNEVRAKVSIPKLISLRYGGTPAVKSTRKCSIFANRFLYA